MMTKNKCKCKHVCKECKFYLNSGQYYIAQSTSCIANPKEVLNCVTGEMETVYDDPYKKNKNGDCPDFKRKASAMVEKYLDDLRVELAANSKFNEILVTYLKEIIADGNFNGKWKLVADLLERIASDMCTWDSYDDGDDNNYTFFKETIRRLRYETKKYTLKELK